MSKIEKLKMLLFRELIMLTNFNCDRIHFVAVVKMFKKLLEIEGYEEEEILQIVQNAGTDLHHCKYMYGGNTYYEMILDILNES